MRVRELFEVIGKISPNLAPFYLCLENIAFEFMKDLGLSLRLFNILRRITLIRPYFFQFVRMFFPFLELLVE